MTRRALLCTTALVLAACAGPRADQRSPGAPAPTAAGPAPAGPGTPAPGPAGGESVFRALLAREAKALTKRPLAFGDGRATAEMEAAGEPVLKREGEAWGITAPIGSDVPVSCILYDNPIDGAASVVQMASLVKQAAADVTVQALVPTDVGVIGETAYIAATLTYTKPSPRGTLGGQLKIFVRPDLDASVMCFHDEVGYAASFKRVAHGLASSLKVKKPGPRADFVDIQVTTLGQLAVGFDRRTVHVDGDGTKLDQTTSCLLLPRTQQELTPTDRFGAERSDRDGRVISVDAIEAHGTEVESQYKLTRQGKGRVYSYKGKQSGKDVTGKFRSKDGKGLAASLLVAGRLRDELVKGKASELTIEEYHPGIAPQPFDVVYKRKGGADASEIVMRLGQLEATGHLDEHGLVDHVSMPIAGMTMAQKRVFVRGKP